MTILVAQPDLDYAQLLRTTVERYERMALARTAASAVATIDGLRQITAIIASATLPDGTGFEVIRYSMRRVPSPPSLLLGAKPAESASGQLPWAASCCAVCVPERDGPDGIEGFLDHAVMTTRRTSSLLEQVARAFADRWKFTAREREVLELAIFGLPRRSIARLASIGADGLKCRTRSLLRKCGAANLDDAVRMALLGGLVTPAPTEAQRYNNRLRGLARGYRLLRKSEELEGVSSRNWR